MSNDEILLAVSEVRSRVCQFRHQRKELELHPSVLNAVDIAMALIDFGIRDGRAIEQSEQHWFFASLTLAYTFENSEWEDICLKFSALSNEVRKRKFIIK